MTRPDPVPGADPDKLDLEAKAARLSGIYLRVWMLARAQHIDILQAGKEAVAKGLIRAKDWELLRRAIHRAAEMGHGGQEAASGDATPPAAADGPDRPP